MVGRQRSAGCAPDRACLVRGRSRTGSGIRAAVRLQPPGSTRRRKSTSIRAPAGYPGRSRRGDRGRREIAVTSNRRPSLFANVDLVKRGRSCHDREPGTHRAARWRSQTAEGVGQRARKNGQPAGCGPSAGFCAARAAALARPGQAGVAVALRKSRADSVQHVRGQPSIAGARFDDVEGRRLLPSSERAHISAICSRKRPPNSGPTSTLVKKSPARPERCAARV